jgi:hypothetical protein
LELLTTQNKLQSNAQNVLMQQEVGELLKLVDELESVKMIGKRIRAHIRWKDIGNAMTKELFFFYEGKVIEVIAHFTQE